MFTFALNLSDIFEKVEKEIKLFKSMLSHPKIERHSKIYA